MKTVQGERATYRGRVDGRSGDRAEARLLAIELVFVLNFGNVQMFYMIVKVS